MNKSQLSTQGRYYVRLYQSKSSMQRPHRDHPLISAERDAGQLPLYPTQIRDTPLAVQSVDVNRSDAVPVHLMACTR